MDLPSHAIDPLTPEHVDLLRTTVAKGATDDQLKLLLFVARRVGLDPFSRQIHFVKRGGNGVIQTGIDGYRAIAARTGEHAGTEDAVFVEEDGMPKSASVTVYRMIQGVRCAFTATARWEEYKQEYNGRLVGLWEKMPFQMLAKCAESLALRKAFPTELSGLYTNEEMMQADRDAARAPESVAEPQTIPAMEDESEYKRRIVQLLKELGEKPTDAQAYRAVVGNLTGFDLIPDNYMDVIAALEVRLRGGGN